MSVGSRIGPYELLAAVGAGGMGVVWRARDSRLGREVALKCVHTEAGRGVADRERFWREARAAATVSHPNVCQVFDVGEHEGEPYLAMELLDGEPLDLRLERGPLPLAEAVSVLTQVLAALDELHRHGVVHRDLKPGNVFLTRHGVKVLDFGLALPGLGRGEPRLTHPGMLVGTPRYMAPEQWAGEEAGPASDLFACGVLLFEMLTGRPAFPGADVIEVATAIRRDPAPTLASHLAGEPIAQLDVLLARSLAKRQEQRFASATAMAQSLANWRLQSGSTMVIGDLGSGHLAAASSPGEHRLGSATVPPSPTPTGSPLPPAAQPVSTSVPGRPSPVPMTRLLALPFRILRPDPETDFLAMALAEAVAASLGNLSTLVVRSPRLAARLADSDDLSAIAAAAEVDLVLVGSLLRSGDRLRLQTQLVEMPGGTVRFAHTAQASLTDLFELQDELVTQLVTALQLPLSQRERQQLAQDVPHHPRAYELYLRVASASPNTGSARSMISLCAIVEECLALDPEFAPAWARAGRIYRLIAKYRHGAAEEFYEKARLAFERALALSPDLPLTHNLYTYAQIEELANPVGAMLRLLGRLEARPADPELLAGLVTACRFCGLLDASLAAHVSARRLDPHVRTSVHYTYLLRGDWAVAAELDDEPAAFARHYAIALTGGVEDATRAQLAWLAHVEDGTERAIALAMEAALRGDRQACEAATDQCFHDGFRDAEGRFFAARCLAKVGATEPALDRLAEVVHQGFTVPEALTGDPWLSGLVDDPRFQVLVADARAAARQAARLFERASGPRLLGMSSG